MRKFYHRLLRNLSIYSFGCGLLWGNIACEERSRNYIRNSTSSALTPPTSAHPFLHWVQKSVDGDRKEWILERKQFDELTPLGKTPDAISFLQVGASTLAVQETDASQHALCTCRLEAALPGSAGAVKDLVETIGASSTSGGPAQLPAFRQSRFPSFFTPFFNTGKDRVGSNRYPGAATTVEQGEERRRLEPPYTATLPRFIPMAWSPFSQQTYNIPEDKPNVPFFQSRTLIQPHEYFPLL